MSEIDRSLPRRTLLQGAGIGIGASLLSGLSTAVQAQTAPAGGEIWHQDYWAKKGDVKLNLWRKRIGAPNPGEPARPIVFLVHGSSNSARSSYDLTVPGKGEYSLMNVLARYGYDVWTMDHDGYGYSGSSGNNSDIASGVEDLKAAMPVVMKETGQRRRISTALHPAASAPRPTRKRSPSASVGLSFAPSPTRAMARRRSNGGARKSTHCAPARAASATPR